MIAVGITDYIDKNMLQQFSSMPQIEGQNFFTAPTFAALNEIASSVVQGSCPTGKMLYYHLFKRKPVSFEFDIKTPTDRERTILYSVNIHTDVMFMSCMRICIL